VPPSLRHQAAVAVEHGGSMPVGKWRRCPATDRPGRALPAFSCTWQRGSRRSSTRPPR
jgi:hypothetical protein